MFVWSSRLKTVGSLAAALLLLLGSLGGAEIIYLKNGDVVHGTLVGADTRRVTLQTPYGQLIIPKDDIERIEYGSGDAEPSKEAVPARVEEKPAAEVEPDVTPGPPSRPVMSFEIRGRAFWYAFESPPDNPADLSIRLRFFLDGTEAATLLDSKPDTYDGNTYYNSFTFSPTDSQVIRVAEGYGCSVNQAEDGRVVLTVELPEAEAEGQVLVRMLYQVNEGSRQMPRWNDAVSRSFSVETESGKATYVVVEQDSSGLDYSGFFRKVMKNLESFQMDVLSTEIRDLPREPGR